MLEHADYTVCFEGNFDSLDVDGIASEWTSMTTLLRDGAFDDGRVANLDEHDGVVSGAIQRRWWDERRIPFAIDSCGNKLCIDLAPGPSGTVGQIISQEVEGACGPHDKGISSLHDFLALHVRLIEERLYEHERDGDHEFVSISRYAWRLNKQLPKPSWLPL